ARAGQLLGDTFIYQNGYVKELRHRFQTRRQIYHRPEDPELELIERSHLAGNGDAAGDAKPTGEAFERVAGFLGRARDVPPDGQSRAGGRLDMAVAARRPTPKAHRRISLEITDHAGLVDDVGAHDAERFIDARAPQEQFVLGFFGQEAGTAQVTEQHGDLRLALPQGFSHVALGQDGTDPLRQETRQRGLAPLQIANL